jgi:hypothetical protein
MDLLDTIPDRVIDPHAYTFDEIREAKHMPFHVAIALMKKSLADGSWEMVYKVGQSGRLVKAYRLKK